MAGYISPYAALYGDNTPDILKPINQPNLGEGFGAPAVVPSKGGIDLVTTSQPIGAPQVVPSTGRARTQAEHDAFVNTYKAEHQYDDDHIDGQVNKGLSEYIKSIADFTEKPLSQEDIQKRERAAYTRAGVGALGNVLNSFSNLFFTGQGAPSQTLPQNPDAHTAVKEMNALNNQKAQQYIAAQGQKLNALMSLQSSRDARKQSAAKMQIEMNKMALEIQKAEREGRLAEAKILAEQYKAMENQQNAILKGIEAQYAPEKQQSEIGKNKASANASNANAYASRMRGNLSKAQTGKVNQEVEDAKEKNTVTIPAGGGQYVKIPKNADNVYVMAELVTELGGPEALKITEQVVNTLTDSSNETQRERKISEMASYLSSHINDNTEAARSVRSKLLSLGGQEAPKNPVTNKPQQSGETQAEKTDW